MRNSGGSTPFQTSYCILKQLGKENTLIWMKYDEDGVHEEELYSKNMNYSFEIQKSNNDDRWAVNRLESSKNPLKIVDVLTGDLMYPVTIQNNMSLLDYTNIDGVIFQNFQEADGAEGSIVSCDMILPKNCIDKNGDEIRLESISLSFIPSMYAWIPVEMTLDYNDGFKQILKRDKFVDFNDIKIPQNVSWHFQNAEGKRLLECSIEYRLEPSDVQKDEFYLSYYGLPEPDFGGHRQNRIRYIVLGIGLLMLGIGVWRMIQKRRENT